MAPIGQKLEIKLAQEVSNSVKSGEALEGRGDSSAKLNMSNYNTANIAAANVPLFEHKDHKSTQSYSSGHPSTTGAKDPSKMTTTEIMFDTTHNSVVNSMTWQSKSQISGTTSLLTGPNNTATIVQQQKNLASVPLFSFAGVKTSEEMRDLRNTSSFSRFANMTIPEIENYPPSYTSEGRYRTTG